MTLTEVINFLRGASRNPGFEYVKRIATHLERVANVSVRNVRKFCPFYIKGRLCLEDALS